MQEVVREFAREQLEESEEFPEIHRAYAQYYLEFALLAKENLYGPEQGKWITRLAAEEANFDAVLERAIEQRDAGIAFKLGANLWTLWSRHGQLWEGRRWLERALAIDSDTPSGDRLLALHALGNLALDLADLPRARLLFEEIRDASRAIEDESWTIVSRNGLGMAAWYQGDYEEARSLHEANLKAHRSRGERQLEAITLYNLGNIAMTEGRSEEARTLHQQALIIQQEIGDTGGIAYSTWSLAQTACYTGDLATAQSMFEQSISMFEEVGDQFGIAYALHGLGSVASLEHDEARASVHFAEALRLRREFGDRRGIVGCVEGLALIAQSLGELEQAAHLFGAAAAARAALGIPLPPVAQPIIDDKVRSLRGALGEAAFQRAWSLGQLTTIEQAAVQAAKISGA
jgi:non-specific serine/threonine protein kinase